MSDVRTFPANDPEMPDGIAINYGDFEQQYDYAGEAYDDAAQRVRLQRGHLAELRLDVLRIERRVAEEQKQLERIEQIHDDLVTYL